HFGAGKALITLLVVNLAQILAGFAISVAALVVAILRGANVQDPAGAKRLLSELSVPLLIISPVIAILVTMIFVRLWAWDLARDRSPAGLGIVPAQRWQVLAAGVTGIAFAVAYFVFARLFVPPRPGTALGPAAAAAATGPVALAVWSFLAVSLAP